MVKANCEQTRNIGCRYLVEKEIGRGGTAVVYRVQDTATGRHLAIKQLLPVVDPKRRSDAEKFFESEFHSLVELAHPRVIEVMDYGRDEHGLFYTMELLDEGDLREHAPLPWKEACSYLRDVCSALSLLHSRRQIHRDLTPRNIRLTEDLKAKLIDFGAMTPMGPCKRVMGTPPFTAPEVVNLQTLDARTDLFSLGATAYFILTGRNAYPASSFKKLRDLWRSQLKPPSVYADQIPKELDELVLSLLSISPLARPCSAAEVIERLTAIACMEADEHLTISQSYLTTPMLVGRGQTLLTVRKQVVRALRKRGGTVMIKGEPGVGRSRFLDACVLEGKLVGAVVLKADANDAAAGQWGVVRALVLQLINSLSDIAWDAALPDASVLGHVLPDQMASIPPPSYYPTEISPQRFENPEDLRPKLQAALQRWFVNVSRKKSLLIAVDDVHKIDEPSAAFLALLSSDTKRRKMVLAVTAETDASSTSKSAMKILKEAGSLIELDDLDMKQTEGLLNSVFGGVANVRLLADRLHTLSKGNPRAIMWIAQHLVNKQAIRYLAGAWSLPDKLDAQDLPTDLTVTLRMRLDSVSDEERFLAQAMALSSELRFSRDECLVLTDHQSSVRLSLNIDHLIAEEIVITDGTYYSLNGHQWIPVLIERLDEKRKRKLHLRLAKVLEKRTEEFLRVAGHLIKAGEEEKGLEVILTRLRESQERHRQNPNTLAAYLHTLPKDWLEIYESALELHRRLHRPLSEEYMLLFSLTGIGAIIEVPDTTHIKTMINHVVRASGYDIYEALDETMEPSVRLGKALELAQQRYETSPERERIMPPVEGIRELARVITVAISVVISTSDYSFYKVIPSLKPFVPLSPALEVIEMLRWTIGNLIVSRLETALRGYLEIMEKLDQPDRAGIEEIYYIPIRLGTLFGIALLEARLGNESALERAAEIEKDPSYQVNALCVRMTYHLYHGNMEEAEQCRKKQELYQIQDTPVQRFDEIHLLGEMFAYSLLDDMTGIKQTLEGVKRASQKYKNWEPFLYYAKGEYQRLRSDHERALEAYQSSLRMTSTGTHAIWPHAAGSYITVLVELGRFEQARIEGIKLLRQAHEAELGYVSNLISTPLAIAQARLGDHEEATETMHRTIDVYESVGSRGALIGAAYEAKARISIWKEDFESFTDCMMLCAKIYERSQSYGLKVRYRKLLDLARGFQIKFPQKHGQLAEIFHDDKYRSEQFLRDTLAKYGDSKERMSYVLELLVQERKARGGFLYTMQEEGPVLSARYDSSTPPVELASMVKDYLSAELLETDEVTMTMNEMEDADEQTESSAWTTEVGKTYQPAIIAHYASDAYVITGLAIFELDPASQSDMPFDVLQAASKLLAEAGDAIEVPAA